MEFKIPYKVKNKIETLPLSAISLDNEIGARFDKFVHSRVTGDFALSEILCEAEDFFATKFDDEFGAGMWRSEFYGKLMLSFARVAAMKNDEKLKKEIESSLSGFLKHQDETGYVSTYRDRKNVFGADTEDPSYAAVGWNSNWNFWGQKYTLWALIECAELLDSKELLGKAVKLADSLILTVQELNARVRDLGVQHGMAAGSILKPMLRLYRLTGDKRYLDFSIGIAKDWDDEGGTCPNLIANAMKNIPPHLWYKREEGWNPKAYEMMSCYDGLCELYRITGNTRYLEATVNFADLLVKYESNVLGSVGYGELFLNAAAYPDAATEVCDVIHWMRLCHELFLISGDAKYIEYFESAFLNAFLAGIYPEEGWGAFFVRSVGRHWTPYPQCDSKYQHCCINNAPRGFVNAAETVVTKSGSDYYVNSYIPVTVAHGGALLRISSGYLDHGRVTITARGLPSGTKIYLRAPEWSESTAINLYHEGQTVTLKRGEYTPVTVTKENSVMCVTFNMTPRIIPFKGNVTVLDDTDYHVHRWIDPFKAPCTRDIMTKVPVCTVRRGPLVLARSKRIGSAENEMFSGETVYGKDVTCSATSIFHPGLLSLLNVTFTVDGEDRTFTMCDYASAANFNSFDTHFFTLYV